MNSPRKLAFLKGLPALGELVSAQVIAQMRERGPRAQAVELPGIGHAPTLMHDDQIRIVANFLRAPVAA